MKDIKIQIDAHTLYLPDESSVEKQRFMWSYDITIINQSDEIIQLLNRHWRVTDMKGRIEDIRGPGVIGLQPIIKPGKQFAYSSFCQLTTPQGTMEGEFEFQTLNEVRFLADIPKFALTSDISSSEAFRSQLH